jgi:uncharacterized RDD family membrane protein YckC
MSLGFIAAKNLPTENPYWQTLALIVIYLGYFLVFETFFSRTPFKMLFGLIVLQLDGERLTAAKALIRTLFRVIDANPALIGGLPAALCIYFSKLKQRWGDMAAGTIVVRND